LIFGLGTDIIHVPRVEKELARTEGLKETLFTAREIAFCEARGISAQHFAARFAAKEAFLKAMGTGWRDGYRFNEIEILNDDSGKPEAFVHGKVQQFCEQKSIDRVHVSLSHTQETAAAVVVLEIISSR
jgi:holo-[acyl-carrier protein] synthase